MDRVTQNRESQGAKTVRQLATPSSAKRAGSTAWRAAHPATGARQEIEGRAVADTRRWLRSSGKSAKARPDSSTPTVDAITTAILQGWTPDRVGPENVPLLQESARFVVFDVERRTSLQELRRYPSDGDTLRELLIVNALYTEQVRLINSVAQGLRGRAITETTARFWSWADSWMRAAESDNERRVAHQNALVKKLDPAVSKSALDESQRRIDTIVSRADS